MGALDTYNARTRRLLTDGNKQFWTDPVLNDDINQARIRVAGDTKCLRQLVTGITLPAGQEVYSIVDAVNSGTPPNLGAYVLEVIGITVYWGNMRYRCVNRPFTEQDAKLRLWQNYSSRPSSLAMMGGNTVYLNSKPDQDYPSDWDVVLMPQPLITSSDKEVIPIVFQAVVPYFAAHLAKFNEQSMTEAEHFYNKYGQELRAACWQFFGARYRDPYRR